MISKIKILFLLICLTFLFSCSESETQVVTQTSTTSDSSSVSQTVNFYSVLLKSKNTLEIVWKTNNISVDDIKQIEIHFQPPGDFSYKQLSSLIDPKISTFSSNDLLTYGFGDYKIKLKAILNDLTFVSSPEYDYTFKNTKSLSAIIDSAASSSDLLSYPEDIAVLSDGSFVVTDRVQNRVIHYNKELTFKQEFKTHNSENLFNSPFGLCVSSDDDVGVVDTNNNRVAIFKPNQADISFNFVNYTASSTPYLVDCIFDNSKNLYVSDLYNNSIVKFSFDLETFNVSTTNVIVSSDKVTAPWGLMSYENDIFVVEKSKGQVSVFDLNGQLKRTIGSIGSGDFKLQEPRYLTIDSDKRIYISDSATNDIEIFDLQGNGVGGFGTTGEDSGEFKMPRGLAVYGLNLFVIDQTNNRIQIFK